MRNVGPGVLLLGDGVALQVQALNDTASRFLAYRRSQKKKLPCYSNEDPFNN